MEVHRHRRSLHPRRQKGSGQIAGTVQVDHLRVAAHDANGCGDVSRLLRKGDVRCNPECRMPWVLDANAFQRGHRSPRVTYSRSTAHPAAASPSITLNWAISAPPIALRSLATVRSRVRTKALPPSASGAAVASASYLTLFGDRDCLRLVGGSMRWRGDVSQGLREPVSRD